MQIRVSVAHLLPYQRLFIKFQLDSPRVPTFARFKSTTLHLNSQICMLNREMQIRVSTKITAAIFINPVMKHTAASRGHTPRLFFSAYPPSCRVIYLRDSGGEWIVTFTTHRDTWEFLSRNRKQLKSGNLRGRGKKRAESEWTLYSPEVCWLSGNGEVVFSNGTAIFCLLV